MKILITGGAGFIGSHLADRLVGRNDQVNIIDNLSTGRMANLQASKHKDLIAAGYIWANSVVNRNSVDYLFEKVKPDVVVHAAATGLDPDNWREDVMSNVLGTVNVVKSSLQYKIKRFIYLQTSLCYGPPQEQPIMLSHPLNPQGSYAISKTAGERYIMLSDLDYVSFRLANCYGPRNWTGPIPVFYGRLRDEKQCVIVDTRRDLIYVDDLVGILLKAIDGTGSGVYHVASGGDYSVKDIYCMVRQAMGLDAVEPAIQPRGSDDVESILLDPSRTYRDFGFVPTVELRDGIDRTVQWYRTHKPEKAHTHLKGFDTAGN